jgi:sialate O-acetylesterase
MYNMKLTHSLIAALLLSPLTALGDAEFKLASVFSDHIVLQRGMPLAVWGTADAGAQVMVEFASQKKTATADAGGKWRADFAPLAAESRPQVLTATSGSAAAKCEDVLVGEVWHACGQSNMAMTVGEVAKALAEVKAQIPEWNVASIRFRRVADAESVKPLEEVQAGAWRVCAPDTVPGFSAAAFFFALRLHKELKVPVAIIDSSRGGTPIEPFIPRQAFDAHPTLRREVELADQNDLAGLKALPGGVFARDANWLPGRLFNSRLAPLARLAVRGVIWYQGESNSGVDEDPRDYEHKMRALMSGWRTVLHHEELPCYFVQLPGSGAGANWPRLREEQWRCASLPHAGMVVTVDLVGAGIHPPNKVDVGERLARWALAKTYGKAVPFSGPLFAKAEFHAGQCVVHFDHVGSGLMVASKQGLAAPVETPAVALALFEVKNEAGEWLPAEARIEGKTVLVSSKKVARAVAVRYAVQTSPQGCNLYNRDGLPASPFSSEKGE